MCLLEIINQNEEYVIRRRAGRGVRRDRESEHPEVPESPDTPDYTSTPSGRPEVERRIKRARRRATRRRLDFNHIDHPGKENIQFPLEMTKAGEKVKFPKRVFSVGHKKLPKFLHFR